MPVIVFSSPKGGCGKTTAATLLATELAVRGASVKTAWRTNGSHRNRQRDRRNDR
jgi:septum formation inhibitor-activating ATPase MinD